MSMSTTTVFGAADSSAVSTASRRAAGHPRTSGPASSGTVRSAPGALRTVPLDVGPDAPGWSAARREAVLTGLLSAAPNTVVVDIDMEAGTALVHRLVEP